jgi:membrane-bound metal-dependent hydrolase YbcI (DUF457 family)
MTITPFHFGPAALVKAATNKHFSHVFLDSIMHSDMQPFAAFCNGNALLHIITIDQLHMLCLALGAPAIALLLVIPYRRYRTVK